MATHTRFAHRISATRGVPVNAAISPGVNFASAVLILGIDEAVRVVIHLIGALPGLARRATVAPSPGAVPLDASRRTATERLADQRRVGSPVETQG